jgi:hypothetical protein
MSHSSARKSVIDSPWYWLYLFCAAGLVALVIMGPKYTSRQIQIEQKAQARQRAARHVSGQQPNTPLSTEKTMVIRLWPLYSVLGILMLVATLNLYKSRHRNVACEEVPE